MMYGHLEVCHWPICFHYLQWNVRYLLDGVAHLLQPYIEQMDLTTTLMNLNKSIINHAFKLSYNTFTLRELETPLE